SSQSRLGSDVWNRDALKIVAEQSFRVALAAHSVRPFAHSSRALLVPLRDSTAVACARSCRDHSNTAVAARLGTGRVRRLNPGAPFRTDPRDQENSDNLRKHLNLA
ncbi:hypothetical protein PFISCL1PPCAC_1066, partial [Pristionchus fissidentatus]